MPSSKSDTLIGFVMFAVLGYVFYLAVPWAYHLVSPVPSVSLAMSAWFQPPTPGASPGLRIDGDVLEDGKPLAQDRLRVSIDDRTQGIRQSVFLEIKNGHFHSDGQPSVQSILLGDRLQIVAEYHKGRESAAEEVYLGERVSRVTMRAFLIILSLLFVGGLGFLWLFTGPPAPGKNTGAIMISYVIMVVFLAVPLALPSVISVMSPDIVATLRETPVGVLVADPEMGDLDRQWVLNIGGAVITYRKSGSSGSPDKVSKPELPKKDAPAAPPVTESVGKSPASLASPSPPAASPQATATSITPGETPSVATSDSTKEASVAESVYRIQGGLVIPLYVLILSLIGGAINMTLRLPDFQREATGLGSPRHAVAGLIAATTQAMSSAVDKVKSPFGGKTGSPTETSPPADEPPSEAQAVLTSQTLPAATSTSGQGGGTGGPQVPPAATSTSGQGGGTAGSQTLPAGAETPDQRLLRETSEWRKGLITQHMSLLAAPFLAIAVYYLLVWLDLLKQPALVLVSFSVGLISDKIVGRITGVAIGIVGAARSEPATGTNLPQTPPAVGA